ncbi:HAMP domain-containing protein [Paracoccus onubensis]|uniref:histidine kinase n=2 Tax=Paracoccus onubensis TaxID=1675788 RepID=A0A418T4S1_9RHOB|nr:HAMP domain-containing protein [Paracoccus onubensis]
MLVSAGVGLLLCIAVATIIILNARHAIVEETSSAFRIAQTTVAIRMPQRFAGRDTMGDAMRLSAEIDALRHVSSHIIDTQGDPLMARAEKAESVSENTVPDWFNQLMRPEPQTDLFPISHYPNILGSLWISTDPSDEIAEVWEDFSVIMPLLALTGIVMVGLTMLVSTLILRRLRILQEALSAIRQGDLTRRAPNGRLVEFSALAEGVNELAAHLQAKRAENDLLQTRLLTLSEAERAKIASDLHDEMGPQLFALNAALAQARSVASDIDDAARSQLVEALEATRTHARAVRDSARAAINDLRPMLLGHGSLIELLEELIADFTEISPEVTIDLNAGCQIGTGELEELSIYRFVRESLLNAIRHGNAQRIEIDMHCDNSVNPRQIVTRITDDGRGPSGKVLPRSYGLIGIRDRARALHATYIPPYRKGDATITELRMPIQ